MDHVSCPVVPRVVTFALAFALSVVSVVADESGPTHQQVQQETEHLHADGHQEEDECVPPLVRYEQLGEDARQGDDDTGRTCGGQQRQEVRSNSEEEKSEILVCVCVCVDSLSPVITPCVYLFGSIPM